MERPGLAISIVERYGSAGNAGTIRAGEEWRDRHRIMVARRDDPASALLSAAGQAVADGDERTGRWARYCSARPT
jgi:hypothetical protein